MSLPPLQRMYIEQQIKMELKAILFDAPAHKLMVGIQAGTENTKAKKKYGKFSKEAFRAVDYEVWKHWRYRKMGPHIKVAITRELVRRQKQEDVDIAYYAFKNEFGSYSDKIPRRPFLHSTFKENSITLNRILKKAQLLLNRCAENNHSAADYLEDIGLYAAGQVKFNIVNGSWTPNSPLTIAIKGSSKPLVDTNTMARAVTAWVTKK